jgi:hypothetical protein
MATPRDAEFDEESCLRDLGKIRPEVLLPGFWRNLAENCVGWANELSVGPFWTEAKRRLDQWRTEYRAASEAGLLTEPGLPNFTAKPESSIRDKVLRRCKQKPEYLDIALAKTGPPIPHIGDLVRTRVACQYIDGVEFLANKILSLAKEMNLAPKRRREGRIEGYFAQHIIVRQKAIFRFGGRSELAEVLCEIQVATDLATRMWEASHPLYENTRGDAGDPEDWQWKPNDPRFISNQLGHMIHLADGLLVQLRQSTKKQ